MKHEITQEQQEKFLEARREGYSLYKSLSIAGLYGGMKQYFFSKTEVYKAELLRQKEDQKRVNSSLISIAANIRGIIK